MMTDRIADRAVAIAVEDLTKQFDETAAVNGLSFTVDSGSITALLGGNGAGKTTTLSMILGILVPTSGRVSVLGIDMLRDRHRALPRMNFSSPYVGLPMRLTVAENLIVYANLYGLARISNRVEQLIEELDLARFHNQPVGKLSAGEKTRVALAKALINEPDVLLLDEPTASLDPRHGRLGSAIFRDLSPTYRCRHFAGIAQYGGGRAIGRSSPDYAGRENSRTRDATRPDRPLWPRDP